MTTTVFPILTQPSTLSKKLLPGVSTGALLVIAIMGVSLALHLYNIQTIGDANAYYTAAVKSMLQSWSNFFFVAAEPGGSVTVDKPPLGLWIEAVFAYFLGVSGFSTTLPNILAGVFGVGLLYLLVKKHMGELAGVTAALVLAITPVFLATNRNNTMDGMLVFTLLLAAWAFSKATEAGKLRWLLLGAFLVGLGFNIKMLQAFLPLPAFYALYFFGSQEGWLKKILNLGMATALLIAISLSWAIVVDLVPAEHRPYIGSSGNNTVMGLMFGHNGAARLGSGGGQPQQGQFQGPPPAALEACSSQTRGAPCSFTAPNGNVINGQCITPPNTSELACAPVRLMPARAPDGQPDSKPGGQNGGAPFRNETGSPGALRFFLAPLSKQMSWLLPFALISIVVALFGARIRLPVESSIHKALLLWCGWLLTCLVFFSAVSGIFHAYYAIMLAPPLGGMVGIGFAQLYRLGRSSLRATTALLLAVLATLAFQLFAAAQYNECSWWMIGAGLMLVPGIALLAFSRRMAYAVMLSAALIIPSYWSVMTVSNNPNHNLPTAYEGQNRSGQDGFPAGPPPNLDDGKRAVNTELLDFLQASTQGMKYLVAAPSSQQGAPYVIETGRPVLYMGGFGGMDEVVTVDNLKEMVANGKLRYILYGGEPGNRQDILNWLASSCSVVEGFNLTRNGPQGGQQMTLYECR